MHFVNEIIQQANNELGLFGQSDAALARQRAHAQRVQAARESIEAFTTLTYPAFEVNWHHRVIFEHLDAFVRRDIENLLIFSQPRVGKTETVSRRLPAYILGKNPNAEIIAVSYVAELARRNNADVQRIIDSPEYAEIFPDTRLSSTESRKTAQGNYVRTSQLFEVVNHRGSYKSAGVGGTINGMGYDYGIIDDPIKNRSEARSATYRNRVWEFFTSVFMTRRAKNAGVVITQTRWDVDDLSGRIIEMAKDGAIGEWVILNFPALATDNPPPYDPRTAGEPLWPNRHSLDELLKIKALNEYDWASLYQQNPTPDDSTLFDAHRIEILDHTPECVQTVRFYDLAVSKNAHADYTVGLKLGVTSDERVIILDLFRKQQELPVTEQTIEQLAHIDGPSTPVVLEAEKAAIVALQYLMRRPALRGFNISLQPIQGDKYTRAGNIAARVNAGMVAMVRGSWNRALLDELAMFPSGAHDDIVDALSGAWKELSKPKSFVRFPEF